jgi:hypothetical protein
VEKLKLSSDGGDSGSKSLGGLAVISCVEETSLPDYRRMCCNCSTVTASDLEEMPVWV